MTSISSAPPRHWGLLFVCWLVALVSTLGALFIGEVMLLEPCVLCWYQRIAMFPLVPILGIACYSNDRRGAVYALPLALAGLALAAYHTLLVAGVVPKAWVPCSASVPCTDQKLEILGAIQIPWLSLAAFFLVSILLTTYLRKTSP